MRRTSSREYRATNSAIYSQVSIPSVDETDSFSTLARDLFNGVLNKLQSMSVMFNKFPIMCRLGSTIRILDNKRSYSPIVKHTAAPEQVAFNNGTQIFSLLSQKSSKRIFKQIALSSKSSVSLIMPVLFGENVHS